MWDDIFDDSYQYNWNPMTNPAGFLSTEHPWEGFEPKLAQSWTVYLGFLRQIRIQIPFLWHFFGLYRWKHIISVMREGNLDDYD